MINYEGTVYRPPSEAYSLIVQMTVGCARNCCTFCAMYKDKVFRIRSVAEVLADFSMVRQNSRRPVERIFLADGDALVADTADLLQVLGAAREYFPQCRRVSAYGAPADVLAKSPQELTALRAAGLAMVYIGAESGDDQVLAAVQKGATAAEIIAAGQKLKAAGIQISLTLISGLGARERLRQHGEASARLVSAIQPEYAAFLTLMVDGDTPLAADIAAGRFALLTPEEVAEEMGIFLTAVDSERTVFRSNHGSNYINLAGTLNADRQLMLRQLAAAVSQKDFRPEYWRGF